jgi:hypothetical protein
VERRADGDDHNGDRRQAEANQLPGMFAFHVAPLHRWYD